eukprot:scaffold15108_cov180-Amphora_coffeaeformis.AAC.74
MTGFPFWGASGQWSGLLGTGLGLGKSGLGGGALGRGGYVVGSGLRSTPGRDVGSGSGSGTAVGSGVDQSDNDGQEEVRGIAVVFCSKKPCRRPINSTTTAKLRKALFFMVCRLLNREKESSAKKKMEIADCEYICSFVIKPRGVMDFYAKRTITSSHCT